MAKDRFSNQKRSVYDKKFRYGDTYYTSEIKRKNVFNANQRRFINDFLKNNIALLNTWEKDFLTTLSKSLAYSDNQKLHLKKIIKKYKL